MGRTLEGNKCHQEMMKQAGELLKKQGFEVVFRARVNNGVADVLGIKRGERIAIECQVVPNWKVFIHKVKTYKPYVSKLILAIPKNVRPRLAPEGIEIIKLDVEKPKPWGTTIRINRSTLERLKAQGKYGEILDDILNRLLKEIEAENK